MKERERERERQTDRQTDRQRERDRDRERGRERERMTALKMICYNPIDTRHVQRSVSCH